MAATTIFFNGRLISAPGSYSEVDPSGLESVGLGANGIVAAIGEGEGGIPVSALTTIEDFIRLTKPEQRSTFRSGDLREVVDMLFAPANDPEIQAGAQEVVAMKVNPALQSSAVFANAQGDAIDVVSKDYGAFTEQINMAIGDGTTQGKLITVIFEDVTESQDDVGGDDMITLTYAKPTNGWDTMTAQVLAGGAVKANATRDVGGLDGDIGTTLAAQGAIEVVSADAGDVGQQVTVYGLDGSGSPASETLTLNGTTAVPGSQVFGAGDVLGAKVAGTTAGAVSVRPSGGGADVFTIALGANQVKGMVLGADMYAASALSIVADGATTKDMLVAGLNASGAQILEKITLTGATPVPSVGTFSLITGIILGDVEAARTLTVSATAAQTTPTIHKTLQKVADYYNARATPGVSGFTATIVTAQTSLNPSNLDVSVSAVSVLSPAEPGFEADLYAIVTWLNTTSLVRASVSAGATGGAPTNTVAPVFLTGGSEGTTSFSDYQNALNWLKRIRVNSIVALTGDPAVHAAVEAHCAYMGGIGRSERDGFAGALNTALTDVPTKAEYKAQVVDLNSRHMRLCGQAIERFNTDGEREEFLPPFEAAVAAGMQAGSPVGTSLTFKYTNVLAYQQDASWNPTDDAEEMIQAGCFFLENVDGIGRRWVRNITTHLSSSNIAFTEASVNEAVNFATYSFRTNMEIAVGKRGFAGTINAAQGVAINTMGLLTDANVLVQWRSLNLELIVDVLEVGVEIAPVIPINFVKNTLHLVTVRQTAA